MASASGLMYTAFNGAVIDFLDDLAGSFPKCRPISAAREFYEMGIRANKRTPMTLVHDLMMVPYGDRIRSHDEEFFMSHDYTADLEAAARSGGPGASHDVVGILKGLWREMTAGDKECVFRHLDVIVELYDAIQACPGM